jgi:rare lipoprotein A (peptidoglycan hydrolase)
MLQQHGDACGCECNEPLAYPSPLSCSRPALSPRKADRPTHGAIRPIGVAPVTFQVVGRREVGRASWYGNWHVGRLTATGERLDTAHPTAAHRSLPMHSLVKVTNLKNGRSVVVTINDRGPVSRRLSIDLSPRAAEELSMRHDGVVPVTIEQVAVARTQQ